MTRADAPPQLLVSDFAGTAMKEEGSVLTAYRTALSEHDINIRMISQSVSEAAITIAVTGAQLEDARAALEARLLRTGAARHVLVEDEVAIIAVVGSGLRGTPGVAARMFGAVARRGVNVIWPESSGV